MPRKFVRRYYGNKDKYSIEQTNFQTTLVNAWTQIEGDGETTAPSFQYRTPITAPSITEGMRKVKHLTISIANVGGTDNNVVFYAVVFVPAGYDPQAIRFPMGGFSVNNYSANQFVMASGVLDFSAGPNRIRTPISRNLNSGDAIYIVLAVPHGASSSLQLVGQVQYAVTLQ